MGVAGKVVVVTGGAMAIGRHVACTFGQAGARVAVVDIAPMAEVEKDLQGMGAEVFTVPTDIREETRVQAMVSQVVQRFGRIDVLVNDAAVVTHFQEGRPRWPRLRDMEKAFWDQVIDTNLGGTFLCCKHVLPHMEAQRSGHIINFGQSGRSANIGSGAYGVSKAAIQIFSQYLAEEEREFNICVISFTPGATIAGEHAAEEARKRMPGPEVVGNSVVEAAELPLEQSGKQFTGQGGRLHLVA